MSPGHGCAAACDDGCRVIANAAQTPAARLVSMGARYLARWLRVKALRLRWSLATQTSCPWRHSLFASQCGRESFTGSPGHAPLLAQRPRSDALALPRAMADTSSPPEDV